MDKGLITHLKEKNLVDAKKAVRQMVYKHVTDKISNHKELLVKSFTQKD